MNWHSWLAMFLVMMALFGEKLRGQPAADWVLQSTGLL
jgi:hypothetical protein